MLPSLSPWIVSVTGDFWLVLIGLLISLFNYLAKERKKVVQLIETYQMRQFTIMKRGISISDALKLENEQLRSLLEPEIMIKVLSRDCCRVALAHLLGRIELS